MKTAALACGVALAACGGQAPSAPAPQAVALFDCAGVAHRPLAEASAQTTVLVFTSHECPIANAMAPTLHELSATFAAQPVRFFVVHVDPDLTAAGAAAHARDYELPGTILLDPYHELADLLLIRRTPEAIVWHAQQVVYRGRIDDQWHDLGAHAQTASVHFLADAIRAVLAGQPVAIPSTEPVGCLLPEPKAR